MNKSDKETKKEVTIGKVYREILREDSNAILGFISSTREENPKSK